MKKPVSIGLSIIGGLIVVAFLLPWMISLNQYKTMIQDKAFEATGRQILINGDIRFGILPSPYARLTDVVITNPEGAKSKEFATVKALDVGVALAPLFSKEIQITHITVSEPAITLEVMENGQNNWQFTPQKTDTETAEKAQDTSPSDAAAISVDNLTIEKGYVRYVNMPQKSQQTVGPIDAQFQIASLQGPISGIGTITAMDKLHVRFNATIDSLPSATNNEIPLSLSLGILNNAANADLKGIVKTGDDLTARIETAVTIGDLAKILAALSADNKAPALPAYLQGKSSLTGLLEWKDQKAAIDNLMVKAGSMEIHGSVAANVKDTMSVAVDLTRVALPPEAANTTPNTSSKSTSSANLAKTLNDAFTQASGFLDTALPKNDINFLLTASQLPLPGQPTLRDIRLAASLAANGLTLQTAEVKLPGNTHIKLRGTLPSRDDGKIAKAIIQADVTSDNITAATSNNATGDKTPIALQATTTLTRDMLRVDPLNLSQKGQSVQGDITYNPKADPVLNIALKGNALNLDSFIGGDKKSTANTNAANTSTNKTQGSDPLAMLQGLKAKLSVDLGAVTFQQKTAKNITANALISDKGLDVQNARIGDLGGMVIDATGKVAQLSPLGGVSLQANAKTPNLSATLKALGNEAAANLGASSFAASVQGSDKALDFGLNGTIDQGKLAINGKAANLSTSPAFNGKIDISHPETATILRNFAKMTPTVSLGAFALQTELAYGADTIKADKLLIKLGSAGALQGHVNITPDGNKGRHIDADIRGDKLALAALMGDDTNTNAAAVTSHNPNQAQQPWSREPINLDALRGLNGKANVEIGELLYKKFIIRNLKTTAVFADNTVTLQRLGGALFDAGTFNVQGQLAAGATGQAHRGDFTIAVNQTDAVKLFAALGSQPFAKGVVNVNQTLRFTGANPYQLVSNLNGDGQIKVDDAIINGLDLDALADCLDRPNSIGDFAAIINQAAAGGQTTIGNLDIPITIRNGIASVPDTTIKTQKTAMLLKGNVQLPPKQVDMTGQISFTEQRNLPPLTLFIKGPMNNPGKSFDTRGFTNFYAQKATEKLQDKLGEKIQSGLGKLLGTPAAEQPAASSTGTGATAPAKPVAPTANPTTAPAQQQKQQDPLKQLGNDMLKNILGGGR